MTFSTNEMVMAAALAVCSIAAAHNWGKKAGAKAASELPDKINWHTSSEMFNNVMDAICNATLDVLRAELTGPFLDDILRAVSTGNVLNVKTVLLENGKFLIDNIKKHLGVLAPLAEQLLGKDGLTSKINSLIVANTAKIAGENATHLATLKKVVTLPDGRLLVSPEVLPPPPESAPAAPASSV